MYVLFFFAPHAVAVAAGITTSNTPVPVALGRPKTMLPDGVVKSSKSPNNVASDKNAAVVSYDAFKNGDGFVDMPLRLNGLYPPSNVCACNTHTTSQSASFHTFCA